MRILLLVMALLLSGIGTGAATDIGTGLSLFERGEFEAAERELRPLAENGDARAQYVLGIIYLNEYVTPPGRTAAIEWIEKAAEQGYAQAQSELARMYRTGDGVEQDFRKMVKWYRRAAEQGDVGAQLFLADAYAYGHGMEPDLVQAYMWYEIAIQYWGPLAVRARDIIAEKMTKEEIARAVQLARNWLRERE